MAKPYGRRDLVVLVYNHKTRVLSVFEAYGRKLKEYLKLPEHLDSPYADLILDLQEGHWLTGEDSRINRIGEGVHPHHFNTHRHPILGVFDRNNVEHLRSMIEVVCRYPGKIR